MGALAALYLERAAADEVFKRAFEDIQQAGFNVEAGLTTLPIREQRNELWEWCATHSAAEIEKVLEITEHQAAQRIALWAGVIMLDQINQGAEIALYSTAVPVGFVDAYASGFEDLLDGHTINYVVGPEVDDSDNSISFRRHFVFEKIRQKGEISLIADSFKDCLGIHRRLKGSRLLLVNAQAALRHEPEYPTHTRLFWRRESPYSVEVRSPHADFSEQLSFDLREATDRAEFLASVAMGAPIKDTVQT